MKNKCFFCFLSVIFTCFAFPFTAAAKSGNTSITIRSYPLSIVSASDIEFGQIDITEEDREYQALNDFVLVVEKQAEEPMNWRLLLKLSPFIHAESKNKSEALEYELGEGIIEFVDGKGQAENIVTRSSKLEEKSRGNEAEVVHVTEHQGVSTIIYRVSKENIKLLVKGSAYETGHFNATKEWVIQDAL